MLAALSRSDFESLLDTHAVIASKILLQLAASWAGSCATLGVGRKKIPVMTSGRARSGRTVTCRPGRWSGLATIVSTTLLLVLLRQALWLVVPFLFAIISLLRAVSGGAAV